MRVAQEGQSLVPLIADHAIRAWAFFQSAVKRWNCLHAAEKDFHEREFPRGALRAESTIPDRSSKGFLELLLAFREPAGKEIFIICGLFSDCDGKPPG